MQRIWEIILGLDRGFLQREGEFRLQFNPQWPGQEYLGAGIWNVLLVALAVAVVVYVYRREGRSRPARIALGSMRLLLLGFLILLLNNPVLTLGQSRTESSVVAVMIDRSISMRVRDVPDGQQDAITRMEAVQRLLIEENQALLRELSKTHLLRFYHFDADAQPIGVLSARDLVVQNEPTGAVDQPSPGQTVEGFVQNEPTGVVSLLTTLEPDGQRTQVLASLRRVLQDLQGQRLAGVVLLTDGRETPAAPIAEAFETIKNFGVAIYPVPVGSDEAPRNLEVQAVNVQDTAFMGDIVNVRAQVRGTGFPPGHSVTVILKDAATGTALTSPEGGPAQQVLVLEDASAHEIELQFRPEQVGMLDVAVEVVPEPGEIDEEDNVRIAQIAVLDAQIMVLYVDGYPRWEYRYIKNEMMRDETVLISCLLTSADPTFSQEGNIPIRRFPENIEELMEYDVVLFGDVDPRQFTDGQLQLIYEFVAEKGGGFGMVAGPRWSPAAFRNTPIEPLLPVNITRVARDQGLDQTITQGFRPALTRAGSSSSIFRFFADREENEHYIRESLQPMFWYLQGVTVKPGVGEVLAEHPTDLGPDGRKAPILVHGRFGAGRTIFSAVDDTWRWRWYTGETIFNTYWVQQLRHLARGKRIGQRQFMFTTQRPVYELGQQMRLNLRVLDPQLLPQLPERLRVELRDGEGLPVRQVNLIRQEGQAELYLVSWTADRVGRFTAHLGSIAPGVEPADLPLEVRVPRLELIEPQVDRVLLTRLASETFGETVEFAEARHRLPAIIPSAAKVIPIETSEPLWDAPLALFIFVTLLTVEWATRKMFGML